METKRKYSCMNCINLKTKTFTSTKGEEVGAVITRRVDEFGFCRVFFCSKHRLGDRKYIYQNDKYVEDKTKLHSACKDYL